MATICLPFLSHLDYLRWKGGQIILEIASLWTIVVGNVYGECRAFCRFKTRSIHLGRFILMYKDQMK
jgi:hypothetical protein